MVLLTRDGNDDGSEDDVMRVFTATGDAGGKGEVVVVAAVMVEAPAAPAIGFLNYEIGRAHV